MGYPHLPSEPNTALVLTFRLTVHVPGRSAPMRSRVQLAMQAAASGSSPGRGVGRYHAVHVDEEHAPVYAEVLMPDRHTFRLFDLTTGAVTDQALVEPPTAEQLLEDAIGPRNPFLRGYREVSPRDFRREDDEVEHVVLDAMPFDLARRRYFMRDARTRTLLLCAEDVEAHLADGMPGLPQPSLVTV